MSTLTLGWSGLGPILVCNFRAFLLFWASSALEAACVLFICCLCGKFCIFSLRWLGFYCVLLGITLPLRFPSPLPPTPLGVGFGWARSFCLCLGYVLFCSWCHGDPRLGYVLFCSWCHGGPHNEGSVRCPLVLFYFRSVCYVIQPYEFYLG